MKLWEYEGNNVVIHTVDNITYKGFARYDDGEYAENGKESLDIELSDGTGLITLYEENIEKIELL